MITINPQILERKGKKEFAVLTYEEFLAVQEELECYEDLKELRAAKAAEGDAPTVSLAEARKALGV